MTTDVVPWLVFAVLVTALLVVDLVVLGHLHRAASPRRIVGDGRVRQPGGGPLATGDRWTRACLAPATRAKLERCGLDHFAGPIVRGLNALFEKGSP